MKLVKGRYITNALCKIPPMRNGSTIATSIQSEPKFKVGDLVEYFSGYWRSKGEMKDGLIIILEVKTTQGTNHNGLWIDYHTYEVFIQNEMEVDRLSESSIRMVCEV